MFGSKYAVVKNISANPAQGEESKVVNTLRTSPRTACDTEVGKWERQQQLQRGDEILSVVVEGLDDQ